MNEDLLKYVKIVIDEYAEVLENRFPTSENFGDTIVFAKEAELPYSIFVIKEAIKTYISFSLATNTISNNYLEKLKHAYVLLGNFAEEQIANDKFNELTNMNLKEIKNKVIEKVDKKKVDLFLEYLSYKEEKYNEYLNEIDKYIDIMRLFLNLNK